MTDFHDEQAEVRVRADPELETFTQVPNELFTVPGLSVHAKLVYIVLLRFCRWGTLEGAYPSINLIASLASVSPSTARRSLAELTASSLLTTVPRYKQDGTQTSNAYTLHHPARWRRTRGPAPRNPVTPSGGPRLPRRAEPCQHEEESSQAEEEGPCQPEAPRQPEREQPCQPEEKVTSHRRADPVTLKPELHTPNDTHRTTKTFPAPEAQENRIGVLDRTTDTFPAPPAQESQIGALEKARERDRLQRRALALIRQAQPEEVTGEAWQRPETQDHRDFLEACGARRFDKGQKTSVNRLAALMWTAAIMGDQSWITLESFLQRAPPGELVDPGALPCLPRLWWEERLQQARTYRWSRAGLLKALLNRERLVEMTRRTVRRMQKGGTLGNDTRQEGTTEPLYVIDNLADIVQGILSGGTGYTPCPDPGPYVDPARAAPGEFRPAAVPVSGLSGPWASP